MSQEHKVRIKTLLVALVMVTCANTGDLLLKRGMSRIGAVEISLPGLSHALRLTMMPVGAFGYAVNAFLAVVILHESVSMHRWFGVFVICVGVLLVGQTKPSTVSTPPV
jgi:drug/metabolite transporter (DMT)-like permease